MRLFVVPVLLAALGATPALADPLQNSRVRYIHNETVAHGPVGEVPAPRKRLSMRLAPTDAPIQPRLRLDARPSGPENDDMGFVKRMVVDQLTATKSRSLVVTAMPQLIKSADGRIPGMGVTIRF